MHTQETKERLAKSIARAANIMRFWVLTDRDDTWMLSTSRPFSSHSIARKDQPVLLIADIDLPSKYGYNSCSPPTIVRSYGYLVDGFTEYEYLDVRYPALEPGRAAQQHARAWYDVGRLCPKAYTKSDSHSDLFMLDRAIKQRENLERSRALPRWRIITAPSSFKSHKPIADDVLTPDETLKVCYKVSQLKLDEQHELWCDLMALFEYRQ